MHRDLGLGVRCLGGAGDLVIADGLQIDLRDVVLVPGDLAIIEHAVREADRNRGRQFHRLGVLVHRLFQSLRSAGVLAAGVGTHADVGLRSGQRASDLAGDGEFAVVRELVIGDLAPGDGQVAAGTVGVGGAHRARQLQIGSLGSGLHQTVHVVHTHRIERIGLELADAHVGALREYDAQLVRLHRFGEAHFVALVLDGGVGAAIGELDVLPVAVLVGVLQLPGLDHRHAAVVGPEVQLGLLQRHLAGPCQLERRVLAGVVAPVVPGFGGRVGVDDLAVDDLLGVVARLVLVRVTGGGGGLRSHVHRAVRRHAMHGHLRLA